MSVSTTDLGHRSLLLIAHPGHELLLHHWMERHRPQVLLLTDGSEHPDGNLLEHSMELIESTGSTIGDLFGRFTESGLLQAMLLQDHDRFACLAEELAEILIQNRIETVITESAEQLLPGADVARLLVDAAVSIATRSISAIKNYEFSIHPLFGLSALRKFTPAVHLELDGEAQERKLRSWKANPRTEHHLGLATDQRTEFRVERLHLALNWSILRGSERPDETCPIGAGYFVHGLNFQEHLIPLGESLRKMVTQQRLTLN